MVETNSVRRNAGRFGISGRSRRSAATIPPASAPLYYPVVGVYTGCLPESMGSDVDAIPFAEGTFGTDLPKHGAGDSVGRGGGACLRARLICVSVRPPGGAVAGAAAPPVPVRLAY